MKQYLVFAYEQYYPKGGMSDFQKAFETLEEAEEYVKLEEIHDHSYYRYKIIDIKEYIGM